MKKTFIMAAFIAVAAMFASCEKETTALEPENLNGKLTVAGFVTIRTWKEDSKMLVENEKDVVRDQKVTVLYGTVDPTDTTATPKLIYTEYSATTDRDGYYSLELPVAIGQTIDEVKAQVQVFLEHATVAYYIEDGDKKFITTDAWYQAEKSTKKAPAGQTISMDLTLAPVELTSHPDLKIDGVID